MTVIDYKVAGVDIDAGNEAVKLIKPSVEKTFSPQVLTELGSFAALYDLKQIVQDYAQPVLVQSIDGVGTKMMIAQKMKKYDTIGHDLLSATANDIIVMGAKPLTLLDYIANDKLIPEVIAQIVTGLADACCENGVSLVGGETAEMPGTYLPGQHDLVGIITGVVDKDKVITGKDISAGDLVLGFHSSGLHTNGYSLARKLFFEVAKLTIDSWHFQLNCTVGEALLKPHLNYTRPILHLLENQIAIKGMAHITGGGFIDNIPRILPNGVAVEIKKSSWVIPPIFNVMQAIGKLSEHDLFHTFNMGIGLVMFIAEDQLSLIETELKKFPEFDVQTIGRVVTADKKSVRLI